jgi:hypothetical protein
MAEDDYETGYKRPPKEHRFKPGKSGNPGGRPKGARSMPEEVRAALRRKIVVNEDGRKRKISVLEATLHRLVQQAIAKGDLRAIRQVLSLADSYGVEPGKVALPEEDRDLILSALHRLSEREKER